MAAAAAYGFREDFLGMGKLVHQTLVGVRLLDRAEILALQVLDEGDFKRILIAQDAHEDGHLVQLRALCGAPSPFAGNNLVFGRATRQTADNNRLQNAFFTYGVG